MTRIPLLFGFLLGLAQLALAQNESLLVGHWQLPQAGITLQFDPSGIYVVTYANGQRVSEGYALQGDQLTLRAFYYGQDQHFRILQLDEQALVLQALDGQPGMQFAFQRAGSEAIPTQPAPSGEVLAEANGYQLTRGHFEKVVRFAEFLIADRLSEAERQQALQECINEFRQMPQAFLQTVEQIDGQMSQLYQIPDVAQLGLLRSMLVGQLNLAYQQLSPDQKPYLARLIEQYTPVVAYDPSTQMALTWRDVEGYAGVFAFYLEIAGQPIQITNEDLQALAQQLAQQFQMATPDQQAALCAMSLYDEYLRDAWSRLSPDQQALMRQQVVAQLAAVMQPGTQAPTQQYTPADDEMPATRAELDAWLARKQQELQTNQFIFNSMQNMLLEQHATSLNIIENIGGSDNYWEVKYNDW
ncbi:MAG: hypothetical protein D6818_04490 [Bacteroidetes bacterium]|nr:MAG: hypothetical protein D6818_04490 [Bacteroidota bacterium]